MKTQDLLGATVKVVRGRKVPHGTVGEVFWAGEMIYGGRNATKTVRLGLRTADGVEHWTAATNVEAV